jgi:1-aminocyclopropane-1-carboxylate deaminase/D-cysteine desulfhydrase-like pyridoxal-dependent ACC family enzyme
LTPAARHAIIILAQMEGILLDPVYTGKAFAGLLDLVLNQTFSPDEHVIFLHTGGLPALWAHERQLQQEGTTDALV